MSQPQLQLGTCQACKQPVGVYFSDGVPLRSDEVHVLYSLNDNPPLVLHACDNDEGSEATPEVTFA